MGERNESTCVTFAEHRDATVADLEATVKAIQELTERVRSGDLKAFERFWIDGGTEEGYAKIFAIREMLSLRYLVREASVAEAQRPAGESVDSDGYDMFRLKYWYRGKITEIEFHSIPHARAVLDKVTAPDIGFAIAFCERAMASGFTISRSDN